MKRNRWHQQTTGPEPTAQTELLRAMKTSHHSFSTGFTMSRPHGTKSVRVCVCVLGGWGAQFYGMTDMSQHSEAQVFDTEGRVSRMIHVFLFFLNLLD